ncbi:conserved oligomeric Golgi complex subunit 3-like isoform X2 [Ptychodera flava]|uniref:conserved oligomeric Golgi complex subunit 3-like isoform X2 n=1 Tax=Ptychodera flava TaxID=63121 RepID=UPI003969F287
MVDVAKMANPKLLREKLGAWELKVDPRAPLSDKQKDSFMDLTAISSNRPLPIELPLDDVSTFPSTLSSSLTLAGTEEDILKEGFAALDMKEEKIDNAQQFFAWFSKVENDMENAEEFSYKAHVDQLREYREQCDQVLEEVSNALKHLEDLQKQYTFVSTKTNALHEACEQSVEEQTRLVNTAESISNKLSYFNELERMSHKLSSLTISVTSESFVPMLTRLDECIAYINSNPNYNESQVYLARFKHCLSKALNLVRVHVVNILQNATQQVLPKKDAIKPSDNAFTLFYGKFRTNAPRVKSLMEQIEERVTKSPEYETLLHDCHQCYFNQREILLGPSITTAINELASQHVRDHCALVRSGCAFMVRICQDEYHLFFHFFSKSTEKLDVLLEKLCNNLYDVLRPLIIHINHLETLAELCTILKTEMLEDHVQNSPHELVAFETVAKQMLEDVQERLVYRTHIYIQTDILNYKPAPGDLAYPEKLEMMESIAESLKKESVSRQSSVSSVTSEQNTEHSQVKENGDIPTSNMASLAFTNAPMSPADLHGMWYPTVRRTLVCLSKLYRCIDSIFQGLSQETLYLCILSLVSASQAITKRKGPVDGTLFLVKHLLILREQIAPFHVEFAIRETALDFSKMRVAARHLIFKTNKLFLLNSNNALIEFLVEGTPQVMENYKDSKRDVDNQLKRTCEEFIKHVTDSFISELNAFLQKASVIVNLAKSGDAAKVSLRQQPFASPDKIHSVVTVSVKQVKSKLPSILKSMSLYLANKDTEYILFKPIKANIQQAFSQLNTLSMENYTEEDQQIIGCPSAEEVNLLLSVGN